MIETAANQTLPHLQNIALRVLLVLTGSCLVFVIAWDLFITVFRVHSHVKLSESLNRYLWPIIRRSHLHFIGQLLFLIDFSFWSVGIMLGFALIVWPFIGDTSHFTLSDQTSRSFWTAFAVSAGGFLTLGFSDITPVSNAMKLITCIDGLLGIIFMALIVSYVFQILEALNRMNRCETLVLLSLPILPGALPRALALRSYADLVDWIERRRELVEELRQDIARYPVLVYYRRRSDGGWITELLGEWVTLAEALWAAIESPGAINLPWPGAEHVYNDAVMPLIENLSALIELTVGLVAPAKSRGRRAPATTQESPKERFAPRLDVLRRAAF